MGVSKKHPDRILSPGLISEKCLFVREVGLNLCWGHQAVMKPGKVGTMDTPRLKLPLSHWGANEQSSQFSVAGGYSAFGGWDGQTARGLLRLRAALP